MPKASLLTDDLRDQLLKELAFGIPISDLAVKYDLKPMQIEYQRGNNSQLYNFYMDFFCIKDEILDWETSDTFRFVLNLLYNKITPNGYRHYLYKGKSYTAYDLIPEANKVLEREGLPLIDIRKPVRVRYTAKRSADQQVDKTEMPEIIRKVKLYYDGPALSERKQVNLIDGLLYSNKRVNWKTDVISETGKQDLPCIRIWYRLWTEGKNLPRGGKISYMNYLLKFMSKHDLLKNNMFNILPSKSPKMFALLELKSGVTRYTKFEFNGFQYVKRIENFINSYCLGLPLKMIPLCYELALKTEPKHIKELNCDLKQYLSDYCSLLEDVPSDEEMKEITVDKIIEQLS